MSWGLIIALIIFGCILTGVVIGWITSIIMKRSMLKADIAADKKRTRRNAIENAFVAAGCEGWFVEYLGACAVGDQIEMERLEKMYREAKNSEEFFMENVARPCAKAVEFYDAKQAAKHEEAAAAARKTVAAKRAPVKKKTPAK